MFKMKFQSMGVKISILSIIFVLSKSTIGYTHAASLTKKQVIILVWDGLRPDAVTKDNTPHLYTLMKNGVEFKDHHASFPTVTVINAASLLTGYYAGTTGFFGNTLWQPNTTNQHSDKRKVDFRQPVFTDDAHILLYLSQTGLTLRNTLLQIAKQQGITTAFIGNTGARFLADSQFHDNNQHMPKMGKMNYLRDGVTPDPTDKHPSSYSKIDDYFSKKYLLNILPKIKPQLSIIWLADPDGTEHDFGFGTARYKRALQKNDKILGDLQTALRTYGMQHNTDIIMISDHAQSFVSGPLSEFPLRNIRNHHLGMLNNKGYAVSGDVRTVDLMTKAGFHAYDGEGCRYDPILSGINANGNKIYPVRIDKTGQLCGKVGQKYNTPAYKVPANLPQDAIIVAPNGSSEYFYIPYHNNKIMQKLVLFLQSSELFGAIFINTMHYPRFPGTLSLNTIHLLHPVYAPDLVVGLTYDVKRTINGLPGIEFSDYPNERGTHGSFSPIDIHGFFAAIGPDFCDHCQDHFPTATVDIAPTIAAILGLSFSQYDGRVINEARKEKYDQNYRLEKMVLSSEIVYHLHMVNATNTAIKKSRYKINLYIKNLIHKEKVYTYFDEAQAIRE